MADDSSNYHRHILPEHNALGGRIMSGNNIISKTHALRNGRTLAEAFVQAFIPTNDNRILVKTTRSFWLGKYYVPIGSVGKVVDLVADGRLMLVDFGLSIVARFSADSDLIQFVAEAVQDES